MQNERRLTTLDLGNFYKNSVGLNHIFDAMNNHVQHANSGNYPPYNIISLSEDKYRIEVAVAGFAENEVIVSVENSTLSVSGIVSAVGDEHSEEFLHKGISTKNFERTFSLADYVEVQSAEVKNGILSVCLERIVPEALKPKTIDVKYIK